MIDVDENLKGSCETQFEASQIFAQLIRKKDPANKRVKHLMSGIQENDPIINMCIARNQSLLAEEYSMILHGGYPIIMCDRDNTLFEVKACTFNTRKTTGSTIAAITNVRGKTAINAFILDKESSKVYELIIPANEVKKYWVKDKIFMSLSKKWKDNLGKFQQYLVKVHQASSPKFKFTSG